MLKYSETDLPISSKGRIYHLDLSPGELSSDILFVGDPGRALQLAGLNGSDPGLFVRIEINREHRGLRAITGHLRDGGNRISIVAAGMGTPSSEIVLNEIYHLFSTDFKTRTPLERPQQVTIIRVGTCGALQASTPLGAAIISEYAIGFDNTGIFYDVEGDSETLELESSIKKLIDENCLNSKRFAGKIHPYASRPSSKLSDKLENSVKTAGVIYKRGITASNSGFFISQGRPLENVRPTVSDLDHILSEFSFKNLKIENMEMESSILFHLSKAYGWHAASICVAIANRRLNRFMRAFETEIINAAKCALDAVFTTI